MDIDSPINANPAKPSLWSGIFPWNTPSKKTPVDIESTAPTPPGQLVSGDVNSLEKQHSDIGSLLPSMSEMTLNASAADYHSMLALQQHSQASGLDIMHHVDSSVPQSLFDAAIVPVSHVVELQSYAPLGTMAAAAEAFEPVLAVSEQSQVDAESAEPIVSAEEAVAESIQAEAIEPLVESVQPETIEPIFPAATESEPLDSSRFIITTTPSEQSDTKFDIQVAQVSSELQNAPSEPVQEPAPVAAVQEQPIKQPKSKLLALHQRLSQVNCSIPSIRSPLSATVLAASVDIEETEAVEEPEQKDAPAAEIEQKEAFSLQMDKVDSLDRQEYIAHQILFEDQDEIASNNCELLDDISFMGESEEEAAETQQEAFTMPHMPDMNPSSTSATPRGKSFLNTSLSPLFHPQSQSQSQSDKLATPKASHNASIAEFDPLISVPQDWMMRFESPTLASGPSGAAFPQPASLMDAEPVASPSSALRFTQRDMQALEHTLNEKFEKEFEMAQLEISENAERNRALELENRKIKETLAQWEKAVKIMIADRESERKASTVALEEVRGHLDAANGAVDEHAAQLDALKGRYNQLRLDHTDLSEKHTTTLATLSKTSSDLSHATARFDALKTHAEQKLGEANVEIARVRAAAETELTTTRARLSRAEAQANTLERGLKAKNAENAELSLICDGLVAQIEQMASAAARQ